MYILLDKQKKEKQHIMFNVWNWSKKKKDKRDEINMPFSYQIFRVSYKKYAEGCCHKILCYTRLYI